MALLWVGEGYDAQNINTNVQPTPAAFYTPEQNVLWFTEIGTSLQWYVNDSTTAKRKLKPGDKLVLVVAGTTQTGSAGIVSVTFNCQFFCKS